MNDLVAEYQQYQDATISVSLQFPRLHFLLGRLLLQTKIGR